MRRYGLDRTQKKQCAESSINEHGEGKNYICVQRQRLYSGYGWTDCTIVAGSVDSIEKVYDIEKRNYPPQGYGGAYYRIEYLGHDLWRGYFSHSESCE